MTDLIRVEGAAGTQSLSVQAVAAIKRALAGAHARRLARHGERPVLNAGSDVAFTFPVSPRTIVIAGFRCDGRLPTRET